jgi:hypothetical protein
MSKAQQRLQKATERSKNKLEMFDPECGITQAEVDAKGVIFYQEQGGTICRPQDYRNTDSSESLPCGFGKTKQEAYSNFIKNEIDFNKNRGAEERQDTVQNDADRPKARFIPEQASFGFSISKLLVKMVDKKPVRILEAVITTRKLREVALKYDVVLRVSMQSIEDKIADQKDAKLHYEAQEQSVIDSVKIEEIKKFDDAIEKLERDKGALEEECPDISFFAHIMSFSDSGFYPKLQMEISAEVFSELNTKFDLLDCYEIQLQAVK